MRSFYDVQRELSLERIITGRFCSFYVADRGAGRPALAAEHFDGEIPAALTPRYADLVGSLQRWVQSHQTLARWVRFEQPIEIGPDFVVRPHHVYTTSIESYEDPELGIGTPPEYLQMQDATRLALRTGRGALPAERFTIIERVVRGSLFKPTHFTYFNGDEDRFVVVTPSIEARDVMDW